MKTRNQPVRSTRVTPLGEDELTAVSGGAAIREIPVVKQTDVASANLFKSCCSGKHFPNATLQA